MLWVKERQLAEVEVFFLSEQVLTDEVRSTWTDEMIQFYESLMGQKVDTMMGNQFYNDVMEGINNEVATETNGNASFMTKDDISNGMDGADDQMLGDMASLSSPV